MSPVAEVVARLQDLGPWAPLFFVMAYAVGTVFLVPGVLMSLIVGAVFGLVVGVAVDFIGATLGAVASFTIARTVARDRVARWLTRDRRAAAVSDAVAGQGLRIVLLLRLSPLFPFNLVNYVLGVSGIRYRDYVIGSIGMLPGCILYTYYGKVIGDVAAVAAGAAPPKGPEYYGMLIVGLVATLAVTVVIARAARSALEHQPGASFTGSSGRSRRKLNDQQGDQGGNDRSTGRSGRSGRT